MKEKNANWRYTGSIWDAIDLFKGWIAAWNISKNDADNILKLLKTSERVQQKAEALGLSDRVAAREILRIGQRAERLFLEFDKAEGATVTERPEIFQTGYMPKDLQEELWLRGSRLE